jgi:hypothetical protein
MAPSPTSRTTPWSGLRAHRSRRRSSSPSMLPPGSGSGQARGLQAPSRPGPPRARRDLALSPDDDPLVGDFDVAARSWARCSTRTRVTFPVLPGG